MKRAVLIIAALLLLVFGIYKMVIKSDPHWDGTWEFSYFYQNDSSLVFQGIMTIETGEIRVWAPKSTRAENLHLSNVTIDGLNLQSDLVHDIYRIKGGHPRERFTLSLIDNNNFQGTGHCAEYCAEGTDNVLITWRGTRTKSVK